MIVVGGAGCDKIVVGNLDNVDFSWRHGDKSFIYILRASKRSYVIEKELPDRHLKALRVYDGKLLTLSKGSYTELRPNRSCIGGIIIGMARRKKLLEGGF